MINCSNFPSACDFLHFPEWFATCPREQLLHSALWIQKLQRAAVTVIGEWQLIYLRRTETVNVYSKLFLSCKNYILVCWGSCRCRRCSFYSCMIAQHHSYKGLDRDSDTPTQILHKMLEKKRLSKTIFPNNPLSLSCTSNLAQQTPLNHRQESYCRIYCGLKSSQCICSLQNTSNKICISPHYSLKMADSKLLRAAVNTRRSTRALAATSNWPTTTPCDWRHELIYLQRRAHFVSLKILNSLGWHW